MFNTTVTWVNSIAEKYAYNGFQMSIKCPTSGGQVCDQEAAVQ